MSWFRRALKRDRARYDDEIITATVVLQLGQEDDELPPRRGSVLGREVVPRDRVSGHAQLMADYFVARPVYNEDFFRRRYVHEVNNLVDGDLCFAPVD